MHEIDPHFAADDPRAALFASLVHLGAGLGEREPTREELVDAAVWASDLFGVDHVERIAGLDADAALEALLVAAHDGFMCECCGHHTLERPATRYSYQICVVCGWEDTPPEAFGVDQSNGVDLVVGQQNVLAIGACEPGWVEHVSPLAPGQIRDNGFETFEATRARLLGEIEAVFFSRERNRWMTLEDARAADDYDAPRPELDHEREQSWLQVPDDRLDEGQEWVFLDDPSASFFLPAILRFTLRHRREPGVLDPLYALFSLRKPLGAWLFPFATARQIAFTAETLSLLSEPWLSAATQWQMAITDDRRFPRAVATLIEEAKRRSPSS